jgi:uncharacterized protein (TIGR00369 family)
VAEAPRRVTRTYEYEPDPLDPAWLRELSGIEVIERMRRGELPGSPMWATVDCTLLDVEPGRVVIGSEVHDYALNFAGGGHGGWLATLLDNAMGLAIMSLLPAGRTHTTTELSVRYVRPPTPGIGPIHIIGTAVHVGRRMATAEGRVVGAATGKLYAHGATSCMILEPGTPASHHRGE